MFKDIKIPELLFVLYFWGFVFLKPFLQENSSSSSAILGGYILFLLMVFILNIRGSSIKVNDKLLYFSLFILLFFILDYCLRWNDYSFNHIYQYVYSGVIPLIFLSGINDVNRLLRYFSFFSAIAFVIYGNDPLKNYIMFGDYMGYGFSLALPAFLGVFIAVHHLKIKWLLPLEILIFFSSLIFANRSAILTILVFICIYFLLTIVNKKKIILFRIIPLFAIGTVLYINILSIVNFFLNLASGYGYYSYALTNYTESLVSNENVSNGRDQIWKQSIDFINKSPIIGHGLGSFENEYVEYSHNIIFDIFIFFGFFGFLFFGGLIIRSLRSIVNSDGSYKILGLLFFCLWFPKLFFSITFTAEIGFWCFLVFPFFYSKELKKKYK